jgi:hypothetical protein
VQVNNESFDALLKKSSIGTLTYKMSHYDDNSPCHLAARMNSVSMLIALCEKGVDPRALNKNGVSPIGAAADTYSYEAMEVLSAFMTGVTGCHAGTSYLLLLF